MAVKIRLARRGRKKLALYDVVVADARAPRDGRFIEKLGNYNPNTDPATVTIDEERAFHWVMVGAQPTDTVRAMLSYRGVMYRKHLQMGVQKGAITQEEADKKLAKWLEEKRAQIQAKIDRLSKESADVAKKKKEAEIKVNEARIEKLKQKSAELEAAAVAAAAEAAGESEEVEESAEAEATAEVSEAPAEAPAAAEEAKEEPVAEEKVEEAPAKEEEPKAEAAAEVKEEAPAKEEAKEEAPAEEAPAEEPKAEAKEEESKDDSKEEEKPAE